MTTAFAGSIKFPKAKGRMVKALCTTTDALVIERSPLPFDITSYKREYTDEQFHADLKKASKRLDAMVAEALEEDAQGKTRKFPV